MDKISIAFMGDDKNIVQWDKAQEAIYGLADQGSYRSGDIQELLWQMFPAGRPEAGSDAAGHDEDVGAVCHIDSFSKWAQCLRGL